MDLWHPLILGAWFSILGTRIGSLRHLNKPVVAQTCGFSFLSRFEGRSRSSNLMLLLLSCRAISFNHLLTPSEKEKGLNTKAVLTYKRPATIIHTHLALWNTKKQQEGVWRPYKRCALYAYHGNHGHMWFTKWWQKANPARWSKASHMQTMLFI